jgi:hypothetical protein
MRKSSANFTTDTTDWTEMAQPGFVATQLNEMDEPEWRTRESVMIKPKEYAGSSNASGVAVPVECVADILDREIKTVISQWLERVRQEPDLMAIKMSVEDRMGHLPNLLSDIIKRLRMGAGTKAPISKAAADHGDLRRKQGYTVAMAVEESRLLQVSIFTVLHNSVNSLEFSELLPDVVTIADEVDAQLKEQMLRFMAADADEKSKGK